MNNVPIQPSPIVADAIVALSLFHVADRASAAALLTAWRRYPELSPTDVAAVLDHFAPSPKIVRPYVGRARVRRGDR